MKKLLVCLVLALALAVAFAACNKDADKNENTTAKETDAVTEAPTQTEAPTTDDETTTAEASSETDVETTTADDTDESDTDATTEEPTSAHECADDDKNHKCDACGATLTECADDDKNHNCDTCGEKLSECADDNGDGECDVCKAFLGVPEWESKSAYASAQMDVNDGYKGQGLKESAIPFLVLTKKGGGVVSSGDDQITVREDGLAVWQLGGRAAWFQSPTGKYAYDVTFAFCENNASAAFVRGWSGGFIGWDPGYYGAAGIATGEGCIHETVAHGKAGVYYNVTNDSLVITIKSWNKYDETIPEISTISVPGVSGKVTVVDLENILYFLNDGKTVAKIELIGSTTYGEITAPMTEKVIVHSWDGSTYEVENALVAADMKKSEFGISNRYGKAQIVEIGYGSAKDVAINDELDEPVVLVVSQLNLEGEMIKVLAVADGAKYIGLYKNDNLIMYYEFGTSKGFIEDGVGITVEDPTYASIPAGEYEVRVLDADKNTMLQKPVTVTSASTPVVLLDAEKLMDVTNHLKGILNSTFGTNVSIADDKSFVTLTVDDSVQGTDYNWYIAWPGAYSVSGTQCFAIRYRTTANAASAGGMNELYLGTASHPFPQNIIFTDSVISDGEWHTLVVDLSKFTDMDKLQQFRLDLINGCASGSTIDIAWAGFFYTAKGATEYQH